MIEKLRARLARHEFLKHVLQLMSGTAVAQVIPLATAPIISRLYTDHEVGVFQLFVSFAAVLITVATGRYSLAIVLPKQESDARAVAKLSQRVSLWVCLIGGLLLLVLAEPISQWTNTPEIRWWLPFTGVFAWAYAQVEIYYYWCNRHRQYATMGTNRIVQAASNYGSQIGFGVFRLGPFGLIFSTFFGQVLGALLLRRKVGRELRDQPVGSTREMAVKYKKMPLLNAPTALMDNIRLEGANWMMAAMFSTAALGHFGWAWRLLQTPAALINSSLSQVFYKELAITPRGHMFSLVRRSVIRSFVIGVAPFTAIYLLSPWLIPFVLGEKWALAGVIGQMLVPWLYMNFITSPISTLFLVTQRQGLLFWYAIPLTATPFVVFSIWHADIVSGVLALSLAMAGMLVIYLGLAFVVAHQYDRGFGADIDVTGTSKVEAAEE
ncbi:MAG: lipopolysaccharide biosynthesis protein [Propionibacteriaceae bacterium]|nr:lipopolysaccharide biosynthesis protein [Propionibacteriaceae bacterium]